MYFSFILSTHSPTSVFFSRHTDRIECVSKGLPRLEKLHLQFIISSSKWKFYSWLKLNSKSEVWIELLPNLRGDWNQTETGFSSKLLENTYKKIKSYEHVFGCDSKKFDVYTSSTTQNELIAIMAELKRHEIVLEVWSSRIKKEPFTPRAI